MHGAVGLRPGILPFTPILSSARPPADNKKHASPGHGSSACSGVWLWLALRRSRPAPPVGSEQAREAGDEEEPGASVAHVRQL
jgi:hypothetical protein